MSGSAISLVLISAFLHAFWNARTHAGSDRIAELVVAYATNVVIFLPWLIIDPPTEAPVLVLLSGLAHGGYIWFLALAYQRGGLATTYPVARGTAPLFVAVAGIWLLDQAPSALTLLGAFVVALGLAVIGGVAWRAGERSGMVMAVVTGAFIASYTLVDARGTAHTGGLGHFAAASVVAVVTVVVLTRMNPQRLRNSMRRGTSIGVFSATAYGLILVAYTRADAANIATLRGTSILFGLALVPRTLNRRLVFGALAVVVGAVLVAA